MPSLGEAEKGVSPPIPSHLSLIPHIFLFPAASLFMYIEY